MALIPPDAAIRLRMETETSLSAIAPLRNILADFANLTPGQRFVAKIQQPLQENNYRALVNGKEITLALPGNVSVGDTLELVVVERNSRLVVAQQANPSANAANRGGTSTAELVDTTELSPAGQMLSRMVQPAGTQSQPVMLNQGEPLLPAPPSSTADLAAALAPKLEQAAAQSGLFYEAHQALWLSGQRSTEDLMAEPQAKHAAIQDAKTNIENASLTKSAERGQANMDSATRATGGDDKAALQVGKDISHTIPAELRTLVQQQLETAATQRVMWQGEVWPGQTMQWQVNRDTSGKTPSQPDDMDRWNTSLALTTPRLGRVEATLNIANENVRIRLVASSPESVPKLSKGLTRLNSALEAAGLKPLALQVLDADAGH